MAYGRLRLVITDLTPVVARLRAAGCVFAEDEAELIAAAASNPTELALLVEQRASGLPLEALLGWVEFCGRRMVLEPGVFVPRRRTEFLVEQAIARARPGAVLLDLCCGSGALGAAVAGQVAVELHASDLDPVAVHCAQRNIAAYGGRSYVGDLFTPLPARLRGRVDLLLANVPYVPSAAMAFLPPEARDHEAPLALDGGVDGLLVMRRMIAEAPAWLADGGSVLVETSEAQAEPAAELFAQQGLRVKVAQSEELSATVVIGTRDGRD